MADVMIEEEAHWDKKSSEVSKREALKMMRRKNLILKNEERSNMRRIKEILRKKPDERSHDDVKFLCRYSKVADEILKRKEKKRLLEDRIKEREETPEILKEKCSLLVKAIRDAKHMVVYTGAGISTAASIPDYRGPDGVWTKLSRGEDLTIQSLCDAEPTLTHMSLVALYQHERIKHVVSQNCDGLHIRSGLPPYSLSEVHGNMFTEVCDKCEPQRIYWRLFDVTEKTGLRRHFTDRDCHFCCGKLSDTIVHFGEKRELSFPQNWEAAFDHAKKADAILCLGSSLKVLKSYHGLWGMNRTKLRRPDLYIVNLQWTPKDSMASLKIHGKVDDVMKLVMDELNYGIPNYTKCEDPLFRLQTSLQAYELNSHTTKLLTIKKEEDWLKFEVDKTTRKGGSSATSNRKLLVGQRTDVSVKEEVAQDEEVITQKDKLAILKRPGWFGKGFRKTLKRKKK